MCVCVCVCNFCIMRGLDAGIVFFVKVIFSVRLGLRGLGMAAGGLGLAPV